MDISFDEARQRGLDSSEADETLDILDRESPHVLETDTGMPDFSFTGPSRPSRQIRLTHPGSSDPWQR